MTPKERAAMQQALEALEELHYSSGTVVAARKYELATAALREALAEQAEQEPVAWICHKQNGEKSLWWNKNQALDRNAGHEFTPLYAASVRTKDLTNEELDALWYGNTKRGWRGLFRAVIAADREKNK